MGRRQERLGKLIKEELADIFQKEGKSAFGNSFITVSEVRMTPDLGYAKIFLSVLNEHEPKRLIENIRNEHKTLRYALGQRIKDQVKKIPELQFYYDDTMDYVEKMDEIFKNIDTGADEEGENTNSKDDKTDS